MKLSINQKRLLLLAGALVLVSGAATYAVAAHAAHDDKASQTVNQTQEQAASSTAESSSSGTNTKTSTSKSVAPAANTALEKGTNHNQAAQSYTYDAVQIRGYMEGTTPYDGQRLCFLTFDDGVNNVITPKILDVLKQNQVHATFFVIGSTVNQETKPLLEREIAEGHAIGMHSFNHNYDLLYPNRTANAAAIAQEAKQTESSLKSVLGNEFKASVWRYPGGHMSWNNMQAGDDALDALGIKWMDWNAMSGDAEANAPTTAAGLAAFNAQSTTEYADHHVRVVLMHDAADKQLTVEALPQIIQFYKDHGYSFGVLS